MNEIVDTVRRRAGGGVRHACRTSACASRRWSASSPAWPTALIQAVGLYHQKFHVLSEMNKTIACSIDKARARLGYDPKSPWQEGMRRSLKWVFASYSRIQKAAARF